MKSKEEASYIWFNSKTKKILEDNKMFWVSGMRCFVELEYELEGNPKWMNEQKERDRGKALYYIEIGEDIPEDLMERLLEYKREDELSQKERESHG